jgi:hypothetical protein
VEHEPERLSAASRTTDAGAEPAELRRAWRRLAERPPKMAPEDAARRVLARIAPRREPHGAGAVRWAAAAALLLALAAGWWQADRWSTQRRPPAAAPAAVQAALPLDEGVVLLWLDDETPLYLTLTPPRTAGAENGDLR